MRVSDKYHQAYYRKKKRQLRSKEDLVETEELEELPLDGEDLKILEVEGNI
ncbi:hypothetical protein DY000_02002100 [Brassica cretica]|uniref:Uncharacterized protein n=1 Tax=Brassica cretica TaxID=69181 RepID=A0ABQ7CAL4_BRACR|nr:hypothetical protein DY000_02002100 [Brassica cretica]